jgi:hypothetical protein
MKRKKNFIFFAFQWCFFIKPPLLRLWFSLQLLIEVEAKSQTLLYYSFVFELHSIHFNCFSRMRLLWPLGKPIPNGGNPSSVHTISPGSTLNQWKACFLIGLKRNRSYPGSGWDLNRHIARAGRLKIKQNRRPY